jgi:hypothetical protein
VIVTVWLATRATAAPTTASSARATAAAATSGDWALTARIVAADVSMASNRLTGAEQVATV